MRILAWGLVGVLSLAGLSPGGPETGFEIRHFPPGPVFVCETNAARGYYDAMIHNVSCVNRSGETLALQSVTIEATKGDAVLQRMRLDEQDLQKDAAKIHGMLRRGILKLYDFVIPAEELLGESVDPSPGVSLAPRTAIISTSTYLSLKGIPDGFRITAIAKTPSGKLLEASLVLPAVEYRQANRFLFPLRGAWWVGAGADVFTDHRWVDCQQFGYDMGQVGEDGLTYRGEGRRLEDYRGFGRDVLAAADGDVAEVRTGFADEVRLLMRPEETPDDYAQRMRSIQLEFLKAGSAAAAGNFIVIRHKGGEYSFYAHLKQGSIRVRKGESVQQGQVIGQVGHSGNSTEPHLHFQVSDGADPFRSRSVPVKLTSRSKNQELEAYLRTGDIIRNDR